MAGLLGTGASTAVLGLSGTIVVVLVVSALAGMGAGLLNPAQQATVADVVGNKRSGGKVLAGFQMAQDTGAIIGPVAAGALADVFGFHVAFGLSGVIVLLAGVGWLFAREPMHRGGTESKRDETGRSP